MDVQSIKVLNYMPSLMAVSTRDKSVGLSAATDGIPSFDYFSMNEIEYMNSQSPAIRNGALEFEEDVREEVYAKLSIPDWKDRCIFERDIDDMIVNPTAEGMQRIVNITDVQTIERVRGHVYKLIIEGANVSIKVSQLVERRFEEINRGVRKSAIEVAPKSNSGANSDMTGEVAMLRDELMQLKNQMQKQIAVEPKNESVVEKVEKAMEAETAKVAETPKAQEPKKTTAKKETSSATAKKATSTRGRKPAVK